MNDEHDERLQLLEQAVNLALAKETARHSSSAGLCLVLPLVAIALGRVLLGLVETLALQGTSQLAAVILLMTVAASVGYRHGRKRRCDTDRPPSPPTPWQTVRSLLRRAPLTGLATLGIAQFAPWPVAVIAGTLLLLGDTVLIRFKTNRVDHLRRLAAFLNATGRAA